MSLRVCYADLNLHVEGAASANSDAQVRSTINKRGTGRLGYQQLLQALANTSTSFSVINIHYAEDLTHQVITFNDNT